MTAIDPAQKETISLEKATMHLLEECRMVLPGIQMTFGFQLIVVFNESFRKLLTADQQLLHLGAMTCVALAAALVMAPAAFHRHVEPLEVSGWLLKLGSRLLMWSMFPLAGGLCVDLYLLAGTMCSNGFSMAYAFTLFVAFLSLWFFAPIIIRVWRQHNRAGV